MSNTRDTVETLRGFMIIRHSMQLLEQLHEIESLIGKIESYLDENGIEIDREKLLRKLFDSREE